MNEDLLVFGYACKLFRDDEKAIFIDECRHLIPWMGDVNLPIDRYDARGTLPNLQMYESGYYEAAISRTSEEIREEEMCQEER